MDDTTRDTSKRNAVRVTTNGPLQLSGRLTIELPDGSTLEQSGAALCRCGLSTNKPYCDGSHARGNFDAPGALGESKLRAGDPSEEPLEVRLAANGPLLLSGPVEVRADDESETHTGVGGALCRCGQSGNMPYCDGSHRDVGFEG